MNLFSIVLLEAPTGGYAVLLLLINILLSIGIGRLGSKRKIGFGWALVFSLVFGVLIGLIIVLCSKKKDVDFVDID